MSSQTKTTKATPSLRFREFSERWQEMKVGEFCTCFSGGTPSSGRRDYYGGEIPFIRSAEIRSPRTALFLTEKGFRSSAAKLVIAGDLLVALYGANSGEVGISRIDGAINQAILCIRTEQSVDFLCFFLEHSKDRIVATYLQGGQGNLSGQIVQAIGVPIPTLPEQRKIADFLTAVDGRIGQLSQKKALLQDYKKGVMQQLFTQALRFKDDHGNDFPEWEEKTLGEIGKITTGKTPSTSDDAAWIGDTMFVTPTDIGEDTKFQRSTKRHVNGEKLLLIPKHSLMFTCIASVGKMSIATEPCITNQQINSVSVGPGSFFEFVYYALRYLTPQIKATQANTTLPIINKTEFSKFVLPVPSIPEQTKIANFLTALDRKIESVSQQITHTQTFKKGLLQQMFV